MPISFLAKGVWNHADDRANTDLSPDYLSHCSYGLFDPFITRLVRVAIKTRDRRYKTIHGDSVVLLGPLGSGKTSLFCRISIYASENNPTDSENTLPLPSMTTKVNIASITNAGVGKYTQGKESKRVIGKVIDIPGKIFDTRWDIIVQSEKLIL